MVFCSPCPSKHRNPEAGGGGSCIWVQNFNDIDNLILFDVKLGCAVRSFLLPPSTSKRLCFSSILKDFVNKKNKHFSKTSVVEHTSFDDNVRQPATFWSWSTTAGVDYFTLP